MAIRQAVIRCVQPLCNLAMEVKDDSHVKILVRYFSSVLDEYTVETLWAKTVDKDRGLYQIDNIPFYGPLLASDDIVFAEYDDSELQLTYRKTIEPSGNSIIAVVIMDDSTLVNDIRKVFEDMDCPSEKANEKYFSMEIPYAVDYSVIKQKLDQLENENVIGYSEPCLSEKHKND